MKRIKYIVIIVILTACFYNIVIDNIKVNKEYTAYLQENNLQGTKKDIEKFYSSKNMHFID